VARSMARPPIGQGGGGEETNFDLAPRIGKKKKKGEEKRSEFAKAKEHNESRQKKKEKRRPPGSLE